MRAIRMHSGISSDGLDALAMILAIATGVLAFLLVAVTVSLVAGLAPKIKAMERAEAAASEQMLATGQADLTRERTLTADTAEQVATAGRISEDELSEARKRLDALLQSAENARRESAERQQRAAEESRELAETDAALAAAPELPEDATEERCTALEAQLSTLQQQLADAGQEGVRLQAVYDTAVAAAEQEGKIVRLPCPREADAEKEQVIVFACRYGKIVELDDDWFSKAFGELQKVPGWGTAERVTRTEAQRLVKQAAEYYAQHDVGTPTLRAVVLESGYMTFRWRPDAGETTATMVEDGSRFTAAVNHMSSSKAYVTFWVWSDSFDVYLAARQYVAQKGFEVNWEPYDAATQDWSRALFSEPNQTQEKSRPVVER